MDGLPRWMCSYDAATREDGYNPIIEHYGGYDSSPEQLALRAELEAIAEAHGYEDVNDFLYDHPNY